MTVAAITQICSPRPDLQDTALTNAELELFVYGSASRDPAIGKMEAGFAVVTAHGTVIAQSLSSNFSAQAAELKALTEACKYAKGATVNIYTDSHYAFGMLHDFGTIWKQIQFLTSIGKPTAHHKLVSGLLEAVLLPKQIAVCKCSAHTNNSDPVSQGNAKA